LGDPWARAIRAAAGCRPLLLRVRIRGRQWLWLQWLRSLLVLLVLVLLAMRGSCEVPGGESGSGERRGGRGSGGRDGGRGCGDGRNILKLRRSARRRLIAIAQ
jgi:uncharacterized membrane protein YgcG